MDSDFSHNRKYTYLFILLLVVIPSLFSGLSGYELLLPDEPREAEIAREMWVSGDFAVPKLNGEAFLEKPPLYYWTVVALYNAAGRADAFLSRLPSAFFGLGTILFVYALSAMMFGRKTGLAAALISCTTHEFQKMSHNCMIDISLAFFVIGTVYYFAAGYIYGRQKTLNISLMYAMAGFAFLSKGFIGVVIPGVVIFLFFLFEKNLKSGIIDIKIWLGVIIFLIITSPWFYLLWQAGGTKYFKVFFIDNHWGRFAEASLGHRQGFFFYFSKIFEVLFPWSILLPLLIFDIFLNRKTSLLEKRREILFVRIFAFAPLALLSFSASKRSVYLLPVIPAYAILTALLLEKEFLKKTASRGAGIFGRLLTVVVLLCMVLAMAGWVWAAGTANASFIIAVIPAVIAAAGVIVFSLRNELQKLFVAVVVSTVIMFYAFSNFELERGEKNQNYRGIANIIRKNVSDMEHFRAFDLSEHERSIAFYLNRTFPEDMKWEEVKHHLLSDKNITYIVNDDKLEDVYRKLPVGIGIKPIGRVDRNTLFLLIKKTS
ncbi:MAG: glycosyltransferase family 39 protein [Candidatus Schekmanbacteria bacterium]|nr:glycosyltransferase family 39 protein [Candidatus Schekmanbacteria bacterium]